jgi:hypothetical protein
MRELFHIPDRGTENLFFVQAIIMAGLTAWGFVGLAPLNATDQWVIVVMGSAALGVFFRAIGMRNNRRKRLAEVQALRQAVVRSTNG